MTIHTAPALAMPMSARAYAARYAACQLIRIPAGARIEWQGRPGVVTHGNLPSEWVPEGSATVSITFDHYGRGYSRFVEAFADEVTVLPATTVWAV